MNIKWELIISRIYMYFRDITPTSSFALIAKNLLQCDIIVILSIDLRTLFNQIIVLLLKSSILFLGIILDNFFLRYFFIPGNEDYYLLVFIFIILDLLINYFKYIKEDVYLLIILCYLK